MSVPTSTYTVSYVGNASAVTAYSVPFYFLAAGDLAYSITDSTGAVTSLAAGDVTVTQEGDLSGGTVVTDVAIAATSTFTIYRSDAYTQPTTLATSGPFDAAGVETALDRQLMQTQQLEGKSQRAPLVPPGETLGALPSVLLRGDKVFAFDAAGDPSMTDADTLLSGSITAAAASATAAAASAASAAAIEASNAAVGGVLGTDSTPTSGLGGTGQGHIDLTTGIVSEKTDATTWTAVDGPDFQATTIVTAQPASGAGNVNDVALQSDGTDFSTIWQKTGTTTWTNKGSVAQSRELEKHDDFCSGAITSVDAAGGTPLFIGSLGWRFQASEGNHTFRPSYDSTEWGSALLETRTGSEAAGDCAWLGWEPYTAAGGMPFKVSALQSSGKKISWRFKLEDAAQEYWIGLVKCWDSTYTTANGTNVVGRCVGVKCVNGAAFTVTALESTPTETTATMSPAVAADTAYHDLSIEWDAGESDWKIIFDGTEYHLAVTLSVNSQMTPGIFMKNTTAPAGVVVSQFQQFG